MDPSRATDDRPASPREIFLEGLIASGRAGSPRAIAISAPRGWGKGRLLEAACERLSGGALLIARLDFGRSVTNPDEFSGALAAALLGAALPDEAAPAPPGPTGRPAPAARLRALIASPGISELLHAAPVAEAIVAELAHRHGDGRAAVALTLDLAEAITRDRRAPLLIAARHFDEFARLTPFPGLGAAPRLLALWLARRTSVRLLAATSPSGRPRHLLDAMSGAMGSDFETRAVPPLCLAEVAEAAGISGEDAAPLLALTAGRPMPVAILGSRMRAGATLEEALDRETGPDTGRLFHELRFDYVQLLERTRGHGASRAILNTLAREEGLDLSGIARRLRRTVGSTLDYLRWLLEVELLRRDGRRYFFADPLLRLHVLMHEAPEAPDASSGRRALIVRFLGSLGADPIPLRPRGRPPGRLTDPARSRERRPRADRGRTPDKSDPPSRRDGMIEID